jgi:Ca2+:H+ antiporter
MAQMGILPGVAVCVCCDRAILFLFTFSDLCNYMKDIRIMVGLFLLAIAARIFGWGEIAVFVTSSIAIIPIAGVLGEATEALAEKTSPQVGGLLNASLGNAAELIITLVAISAGKLELVKASIIGSILGNLLFVLGFSLLLGGIKHGVQQFDRDRVSVDATLAVLAAIVLGVPSLFNELIVADAEKIEWLSLSTAGVVLFLYLLTLLYTFQQPNKTAKAEVEPQSHPGAWSVQKSLYIMVIAVIGLAIMSEFLVGSLDAATKVLGLTEFFVGIIVVPIIGNVAEHVVAVQVARKNQMDLSLSIALGSTLQIALFVAPLLVFVSLLLGHPLTLEFNHPELIAMIAAALIAALVAFDGQSNWLEGAMLLAVYSVLALGFFFLPATI